MARLADTDLTKCPGCNGTGTNTWDCVCKVCDSTGKVTVLRRSQWLANHAETLAQYKGMQPPLFL